MNVEEDLLKRYNQESLHGVVQRLVKHYRDEYFKARSVSELSSQIDAELSNVRDSDETS